MIKKLLKKITKKNQQEVENKIDDETKIKKTEWKGDIVYFEVNNWICGRDYPSSPTFINWLGNDFKIVFNDDEWCRNNELCVYRQYVDMSTNYTISAKKEWVDRNCPELFLPVNKKFLRFPYSEDPNSLPDAYFGIFREYNESNFGSEEDPTYDYWESYGKDEEKEGEEEEL